MLQVRLRFENYVDAHTLIIAIKDVYLGGPAHRAGLQPFTDFILGTSELNFKDLSVFAKYLTVNKGTQVELVVYNTGD
jgi:predicted metalloprotease with PDZ domain